MAPWLHRIDPIALQFPEFTVFGATLHPAVHWYGIMYLLAFAVGWWLGRTRVRAGAAFARPVFRRHVNCTLSRTASSARATSSSRSASASSIPSSSSSGCSTPKPDTEASTSRTSAASSSMSACPRCNARSLCRRTSVWAIRRASSGCEEGSVCSRRRRRRTRSATTTDG